MEQVAASLLGGVHGEVLERAFEYWKRIDGDIGHHVEEQVRAHHAARPAETMTEA